MFIPVPGLIISTAVWIRSVVLLINLLTQDFRLNRVELPVLSACAVRRAEGA